MNEEMYWVGKLNMDSEVIECRKMLIEKQSTPFMLLKPTMSLDGNQWCALHGSNPMEGVCAFGNSPAEAEQAFNKAWYEEVTK